MTVRFWRQKIAESQAQRRPYEVAWLKACLEAGRCLSHDRDAKP